MVIKRRLFERERIAGVIIFISLFLILLSVIGIRILNVKVSNIELVDRGLYTIVTDYGPINIDQNDILRIERTYAKAAITGTPVELDRIYTTKGFIYISSQDPFYNTGHQLINSVDFVGNPIWIRSNNSAPIGSDQTQSQLQNANLRDVQPFRYAIGTPPKYTPIVFSVLSLQYFALGMGGIALLFLIFPLRLGTPTPVCPFGQHDSEYRPTEDQLGAVAK